jgi:hypothetical protein
MTTGPAFVTDPSPNFIAQAAHLFFAGFVLLAAVHLFGASVEWPVVGGGVLLSAAKEFFYDMHYESPGVSGELPGGFMDFSFYMLGLFVAIVILAL